eukprot:187447_1
MRVPHKVHFRSVRFGDLITIRQPATNSFKQKHDKRYICCQMLTVLITDTSRGNKYSCKLWLHWQINYDYRTFNSNRNIFDIQHGFYKQDGQTPNGLWLYNITVTYYPKRN